MRNLPHTDAPHPLVARALEEHDRTFSGDGAPRPFAGLRRQARDAVAALGLPTRRSEAWKYTDVRRALPAEPTFVHGDGTTALTADDLAATVIPGLDAARVVVVNGAFVPALSDLAGLGRVRVLGLRAAANAGDPVLRAHLGRHLGVTDAVFVALNTALDLDGVVIHVPEGVLVERPIHVVHLVDAEAEAVVQSRHLFVFEAGSRARVIETMHAHRATPTFGNHVAEVVVGPEAVIGHVRVQDEGEAASQVNTTHVHQSARSTFQTTTFTFASALVRNDLTLVPGGEGCTSHLNGLYVATGEQHVDNHTLVDHAAPGCTSNELYKGILYDRATGVFNGKVLVRREGQQTNAYQQSQGVVLSDDARHFSKPELEIYADDVKCSHGSTTGAVEPEALFYCRARGISFEDARAMLLYAFAHDVVAQVQPEALRSWLDARIAERLK